MTASLIREEPGNGRLEIWPLPTATDTLQRLLTEIFRDHWHEVWFGSMVQGAVFEIRAPNAPERIRLYDGYLTVDFGPWHFHLCIGDQRGAPGDPIDPALARHRRTARAELYRRLREGDRPSSWGLRLFNGQDEQQLTVFLPNPYLSSDQQLLKEPAWSQLDLWERLRRDYLGLPPDPRDRQASRRICDG